MKLLINTTSPYARLARIALWEKGFHDIETQILDPWADAPELLAANAAARVPSLITDDGQALTESLLIVLWLEKVRPDPSLLGSDPTSELSRAGIAMGVIEAAAHTIIIRNKITGPSFDESPVGLRRRRTMVEGLKRIDAGAKEPSDRVLGLATITAVVALDYIRFRFSTAEWVPKIERLERLRRQVAARPSIEQTMPYG